MSLIAMVRFYHHRLRGYQTFFFYLQSLLVPGDLTDEKVVQRIVEETVAHFGQLDVLVNSGGILAMGTVENTTLEDYDRVMNINVR